MRAADDLSDQLVGSVTEATQLSTVKKSVDFENEALTRHEKNFYYDATATLAVFDATWEAFAAAEQLAGMALEDVSSWMTRRDNVLQAEDALRKCSVELERAVNDAEASRAKVAQHLSDAGVTGQMQ